MTRRADRRCCRRPQRARWCRIRARHPRACPVGSPAPADLPSSAPSRNRLRWGRIRAALSTRSGCDSRSWPIRYLTSSSWLSTTPSIDTRLLGVTESGRSVTLPCLRNLGDHPANGPNNSHDLLLTIRVSKWAADIGGAPGAGTPYTLARCAAGSTGLPVRRNRPPTGKPPKPLASLMPDFCSSGSASPPAPTKTNLA